MRGSITRKLAILVAASVLPALAIGATAASAQTTSAKQLAATTLNGSGSSLQLGFDQVAIGDFKKIQRGITVKYESLGSGTGRQQLSDQVTDFAGSDAPYPPADLAKVKGGPILYFPTVADPIMVAYHVSGLKSLQLSGPTIAKIFQGQITTWNDPAIAAENKGVKLPGTKITVAVRSDSSGTTNNFTTFLAKAAPGVYTLGASSKPSWPSSDQQGAQNTGVAQIVQSTDGAIGYVDYSDGVALQLKAAKVKNAAGKYLAPTLAGASVALAGATVNPDLTYDPIFAPGAKAYAITSPTYIIAYKSMSDPKKAAALKAFLNYVYSTAGQGSAKTVYYAALPKGLLKKAKAQVARISAA